MEVGMATKLDKLLEKEAQIKAQIQQAKAAEQTLEKKRDTRRKILVGAAVMARVQNGEWPKADLQMMMDGFLTRPNERELFELDGAEGVADEGMAVEKADTSQVIATAQPEGEKGTDSGANSGVRKAPRKLKGAGKLPERPLDLDEFNV